MLRRSFLKLLAWSPALAVLPLASQALAGVRFRQAPFDERLQGRQLTHTVLDDIRATTGLSRPSLGRDDHTLDSYRYTMAPHEPKTFLTQAELNKFRRFMRKEYRGSRLSQRGFKPDRLQPSFRDVYGSLLER